MDKQPNRNIPLRPLNKGMRLNEPAQMMEIGAFRDVAGLVAGEQGLRRSPPPVLTFDLGTQLDPATDGPISQAFNFNYPGGDEIIVAGKNYWYKMHPVSGLTPLTPASPGDNQLAIDRTFIPDYAVYSALGVTRALMVDGEADVPKIYDGTSIAPITFDPDSQMQSFPATPKAISFFDNRVWLGCGNTLVWSNIASWESYDAINYLTFDQFGDIKKIVSMGSLLVVFFTNAIYFGRPANYTGLPYAFTKLDTGSIGLVGQGALTKFDDGLFFIGQDDVYYMSSAAAISPVGSPIASAMLDGKTRMDWSRAIVDVRMNRILFGVGEDQQFTGLWSFNYKTKGWSRESAFGTNSMFSLRIPSSNIWGNPPTIDGTMIIDGVGEVDRWSGTEGLTPGTLMEQNLTWELMQRSDSVTNFAFLVGNTRFYVLDPDSAPARTDIRVESGDFDFGEPDRKKTVNRLGVKLGEISDYPVEFNLRVSTDRGRTWKTWVGQHLLINPGEDESWMYFRATGSLFRFELTSTSTSDEYIINEIVLRGKARGLEVR